MRRSKQEIYADILKVLAIHGASKPTQLAYKAKVNTHALNQYLNYLCQQNLVEKRTMKKRLKYAVTKKGWRVVKSRESTPFSLQPIVCYSLKTSDLLKEKGCTL